jgi:hypothetical protein
LTKGGGFGIIVKLTRENERRRTLKIKQRKETKGPVKIPRGIGTEREEKLVKNGQEENTQVF